MKSFVKIFIALVLAFGLSIAGAGAANASGATNESEPAGSPAQIKPEYQGLPSTMEAGKKYKLTVNTEYVGELELEGKFSFLNSNGEKLENVKTTLSRTKKYYTTTGYFTPKAEGTYLILFGLKQKNAKGEIVEAYLAEGSKEIKIVVE